MSQQISLREAERKALRGSPTTMDYGMFSWDAMP